MYIVGTIVYNQYTEIDDFSVIYSLNVLSVVSYITHYFLIAR
jgi:hypothetical protein